MLARSDVDKVWGWTTTAGKLRARRRADMIISGAGLHRGVNVLEIGCGTGIFTEMFARTGSRITAVDISGELLKKAKARLNLYDRVTFLEGPFETSDIEGAFDCVVGSSVLHHLDVDAALAKIYALLKPGGTVAFTEPNMLNPQVFLERKLKFLHKLFSYVSKDETAFFRFKFCKALKAAGFTGITILPFDWLHPRTPRFLVKTLLSLGNCLEKIPLVKELSGSLYICARRPA
ncbi:MAG: class I SAM-dependent methyltransferase [Candidatus Omnitrophica bacterium]|nr:class I SAM-dependent methyltransferase [Candidatus Omnitrophota bacterium]